MMLTQVLNKKHVPCGSIWMNPGNSQKNLAFYISNKLVFLITKNKPNKTKTLRFNRVPSESHPYQLRTDISKANYYIISKLVISDIPQKLKQADTKEMNCNIFNSDFHYLCLVFFFCFNNNFIWILFWINSNVVFILLI